MKKIYLLLTHSGTVPSIIIRACTRKPYTHVSLSLDPSLTVLYSFGRKRPRNPLAGGFTKESINGKFYERFHATTYRLYECHVTDRQFDHLKHTLAHFELDGPEYHYNYLGLAATAVGIPIKRRRHHFCSQFVARMLEESGILLFEKPWTLVAPDDFRNSKQLHMVSEGLLSDMKMELSPCEG